jgi:hypothetical protein
MPPGPYSSWVSPEYKPWVPMPWALAGVPMSLTVFYFGFVKLRVVGALQPPQLIRDAKLLFYCCGLLEE